jgi:glyoxylase-like metal-dependent hydrolase (beta-lactamase superfamily II)
MKPSSVALLVVLLGCAASRQGHRYSNSEQEQGDRRVGQYISSEWSFETSSFWIEGPDGLILIDTQFLPSALRKKVTYAEQATGKKAKLAIVLHPNPDRFNGTAWLQSLGVQVVTSEQVRGLIPGVHQKWAPVFFEKYWAGRYPKTLALPDSFGSGTQELSAGGVTVKAHVLGSGCSPAHVVIEWEGHLFVGDLVANGTHSWFEGGRIDEWLKRLDELRALQPKWIHPGRGLTGGPELLDRQMEYLHAVMEAVATERPHGVSTPDAFTRITEKVTQRYPNHHYPVFLPWTLRAEWARQAAQNVSSP